MQLPLFTGLEVHGQVATAGHSVNLSAWAAAMQENIYERFIAFLKADTGLLGRLVSCTEVWIKPNITSGELPQFGITTQPHILDCALRAIRFLRGSSKGIFVADSSVVGCDTRRAAFIAGIKLTCDVNGVRFVDLRRHEFLEVQVPNPLVFPLLHISAPFCADSVFKINIGKLKSTYGSPISFCLKNTNGLLPDQEKLQFHLKGLQQALCDLSACVNWDLAILEGLPMSELGRPAGSGALGICTDPVVLDAFFSLVTRIPWQEAYHILHLAKARSLTHEAFQSIPAFDAFRSFCAPLAYSRTDLVQLAAQYGVSILDGKPCSACTESFAKALPYIRRGQSRTEDALFVLGASASSLSAEKLSSGSPVFIGNCSLAGLSTKLQGSCASEDLKEACQAAQKIPGCPPTIDGLKQLGGHKSATGRPSRVSEEILHAFEINYFQLLQKRQLYQQVLPLVPQNHISFDALGEEQMIAGELICAAICHQMNWEFLRRQIFEAIASGDDWWRPPHLHDVKPETIAALLAGYHDQKRVKARQRASILKSLAQIFCGAVSSYCDIVSIDATAGELPQVVTGRLETSRAFSADPARKKMQVFLHSVSCYEKYRHLDVLCEPAIDYHVIRLYLRRGDVFPISKIGLAFLNAQVMRRASTVTALRRVVSDAMKWSAQLSGLPVRIVNGIEWWIGRSVCLRDAPDCMLTGNLGSWLQPSHQSCPFKRICFAFNHDHSLLELREPSYSGSFY